MEKQEIANVAAVIAIVVGKVSTST